MKKLICIFFLSQSVSAICQDTIGYRKVMNNERCMFFKKKDTLPFSGVVIRKSLFGKKKELISFQDGVKNGKYISYRRSGKIRWECDMKYGDKYGDEIDYYKNGRISYQAKYENNLKNGKSVGYYKNGQIQYSENFKDDLPDGTSTWYYSSGKKESETEYKNGKKYGKMIWYNSYGIKESEVSYQNGQKNGLSISYNGDGSVNEETEWLNDKKNGFYKSYYDDKIETSGFYKDGKRDGEWIYYDIYDGGIMSTQKYVNGIIVPDSNFVQTRFFTQSADVMYGTRLFHGNFNKQFNTTGNFTLGTPVQLIGIGESGGSIFSVSRQLNVAGHFSYCQVIPQEIIINDTIKSKVNGFIFSLCLFGGDLFHKSKTMGLLVSGGFNTGRLRLSGNEWARQKNPFFSPKITIQPKIRLRKMVFSFRGEYEWDISSPNWRRTHFATKDKIALDRFRETGATLFFCFGVAI